MRFDDLIEEILEINTANGWNRIKRDDFFTDPYRVPAVLALIHSELSEALEDFRNQDIDHFSEEIADVFIRCFDCVGGLEIDIEDEIQKKLLKNRKRAYKHGGKII